MTVSVIYFLKEVFLFSISIYIYINHSMAVIFYIL
uniref:Uncharacterized protein n=1 Tax=Anguilla anguilla TaxID=7936 RepID=A0A0E9TI08_ANGAN